MVPPGRLVRYDRDQVGNDVTAALRWCDDHAEPVWVYGDGSFQCPQEAVVRGHFGFSSDDREHHIVNGPWEDYQ